MDPEINIGKVSAEDRSSSNWERETIVKLASAGLKEQRRARKWGIFFKLLGFAYLTIFIISLLGFNFSSMKSAAGSAYSVGRNGWRDCRW